MVTVFLAEGFEEIEAICPIDILRRGNVPVRTCSISDSLTVMGAHGIPFVCDTLLSSLENEEEMILLPGGMPGSLHLKECEALKKRALAHAKKGGALAAICAAPTVLGAWGLLSDCRATCYPGMEGELFAKEWLPDDVVTDGRIITSRGAGTAFSFGLSLLAFFKGEEAACRLAKTMCFEGDLR